jgi:hypothetical protein
MSAAIILRSFAAVLVCVLGVVPARAETPWIAALTQQALSAGYQATLPPNVSLVLGLAADGKSVPVKQLVTRAEQKVRTFNVSVAHHRDLVIFSVDEATQATVAYLLAPGGKLRKAVSYQIGAVPRQLSAAEARAGFAAEVRYWSGRAREGVLSPAP